jgi:hypothetical protein
MEYTITFTPKSVADHLEISEEFVTEYWEAFHNYLDNFHHNWMSDVLWEDSESIILDDINFNWEVELDEFPKSEE